jgi:hypothetical protein
MTAHAHYILAHLGSRKTMYYLKDNVWWKTMLEDVKIHCNSCQVCKGAKSNNDKPYGLLHHQAVCCSSLALISAGHYLRPQIDSARST